MHNFSCQKVLTEAHDSSDVTEKDPVQLSTESPNKYDATIKLTLYMVPALPSLREAIGIWYDQIFLLNSQQNY